MDSVLRAHDALVLGPPAAAAPEVGNGPELAESGSEVVAFAIRDRRGLELFRATLADADRATLRIWVSGAVGQSAPLLRIRPSTHCARAARQISFKRSKSRKSTLKSLTPSTCSSENEGGPTAEQVPLPLVSSVSQQTLVDEEAEEEQLGGVIATVLKHNMEVYSGDSCIARVRRLSSRLVVERDDEATMAIEGNPPSSIGLGLGATLLASMRRRWQGLGNINNSGGDRLGRLRMKRD